MLLHIELGQQLDRRLRVSSNDVKGLVQVRGDVRVLGALSVYLDEFLDIVHFIIKILHCP